MNETVIVKKIKHQNFTTVDNGFVKNEKLSWKAKGILLYLVSLPDDWVLNQKELKNHSTDGLASLRAGLDELKSNGYLNISQIKDEHGKFIGTKYEIDELGLLTPKCEKPKCENPNSDNPKSENPKCENRNLLNTNNNKILNKQNTNIQISSAPSSKETAPSSLSEVFNQFNAITDVAEEQRQSLDAQRKVEEQASQLSAKDNEIAELKKQLEEAKKSNSSKTKSKKTKKAKEEVVLLKDEEFYKPIYEKYRHNFFNNFKGVPNCKGYKVITDKLLTEYKQQGLSDEDIRDLILTALDNGIKNEIIIKSNYSFAMMTSENVFPGLSAKRTSAKSSQSYTNRKGETVTTGIDYHNQDYSEEF